VLIPTPRRILVAREPADFRKPIDGLAALCQIALDENPLDGTLFVFRNRRCNAVKLLMWTHGGFSLVYKKLEKGTFRWPEMEADRGGVTAAERAALLEATLAEREVTLQRQIHERDKPIDDLKAQRDAVIASHERLAQDLEELRNPQKASMRFEGPRLDPLLLPLFAHQTLPPRSPVVEDVQEPPPPKKGPRSRRLSKRRQAEDFAHLPSRTLPIPRPAVCHAAGR